MKLEASLKYLTPQSMNISDTIKSTSPDRITSADVLHAMGATSHRAQFGLTLFLGKAGISQRDEQRAVQALARYAMEVAPKNVRKAAGKAFGACMLRLAQFAFAEYSRSAATIEGCPSCDGHGFNGALRCETCGGKGQVSARCRCGGKGEVLDRKATKEQGTPVFKRCERCEGRGFSAVPSTAAYKAIAISLPDLHVRTWTRNWKPFYEMLLSTCYQEEQAASDAFQSVTRAAPIQEKN